MHQISGPMQMPKRILIGLALWVVAEFCVFALVVSEFGVTGALLLGLTTTLLGFSLMRRLGRDAAAHFRQIFGSRGVEVKPEALVDGSFAAIGATLLILPGFLSDFVGLALCAPSVRFWLADRWKGRGKTIWANPAPARDHVIDLGSQEWRRIDEPQPDLGGHR